MRVPTSFCESFVKLALTDPKTAVAVIAMFYIGP